jgi:hypothetical protein
MSSAPAPRHQTITLVTRMRPGTAPWNRALFLGTRLFPRLIGIAKLGSVHTTRWSVLTRIPYNGRPQVRARPQRPVLLWESDYTGLVGPYVAAFVRVLPLQIGLTWRTSYGFPGTRSITPLSAYIERSSVAPSYAWAACPQASERMVTSGLAVAREHALLRAAAADARLPDSGFRAVYEGFLRRRQADL